MTRQEATRGRRGLLGGAICFLASNARQMGRGAEALALQRRALRVNLVEYGGSHSSIALAHHNLGVLLH